MRLERKNMCDSKRTKRETLTQQGSSRMMQAHRHLLFLLLLFCRGNRTDCSTLKTCGNERDSEAPKLKVSHNVGVAMEAE